MSPLKHRVEIDEERGEVRVYEGNRLLYTLSINIPKV